jgi:hypothetical protein
LGHVGNRTRCGLADKGGLRHEEKTEEPPRKRAVGCTQEDGDDEERWR